MSEPTCAFAVPMSPRPLASARSSFSGIPGTKCAARRPRVVCAVKDPGDSKGSSSKSSASLGGKRSFLDGLGKQFSVLKAAGGSKDSPDDSRESSSDASWLPDWAYRKAGSPSKSTEDGHEDADENSELSSHCTSTDSDELTETQGCEEDIRKAEEGKKPNPFGWFARRKEDGNRHGSRVSKQKPASMQLPTLLPRPYTKPRGSLKNNDAPPEVEEDKFAEMVRRVLDVIVPNRGKREETNRRGPGNAQGNTKPGASSTDEQEGGTDVLEDRERGNYSDMEEDSPSLNGVEELYQPPSKPTDLETERIFLQDIMSKLSFLWPKIGDKKQQDTEVIQDELGENVGDITSPTNVSSRDEKVTDDSLDVNDPNESGEDSTAHPVDSSADGPDGDLGVGKAEPISSRGRSGDEKAERERRIRRAKEAAVAASSSADVSSVPQQDVAAIRMIFGSETFFATETLTPPGGLIFRGNLRGEPVATLEKLEKRLADRLGDKYTLCLAEGEEDLRPVVVVVPTARDKRPSSRRQRVVVAASIWMSSASCLARSAYAYSFSNQGIPNRLVVTLGNQTVPPISPDVHILSLADLGNKLFAPQPVRFVAVSIGLIIMFSQLMQRFVARRYKTRVGLPFLVPSYQLGTFGALVQVASPTPSRSALFDIAVAGTASMLLASLVMLWIGLKLTLLPGTVLVKIPKSMLDDSLLIGWLSRVLTNGRLLGSVRANVKGLVLVHPAVIVGANCLTIAGLNLLPIRSLDGGRIVSAIYGRRTAIGASRITVGLLLILSAKSTYLFVFMVLVMLCPWTPDRPARNELSEPNSARAIIGYLFLLTMLAILLPFPIIPTK